MIYEKSIFRTPSEIEADAFLAATQPQQAAFSRKRELESQIAASFRLKRERLESYAVFHGALVHNVEQAMDVNISLSILGSIENDPSGAFHITFTAAQFSGIAILQLHGPEIVKISAAKLDLLQSELKKFQGENRAILKSLGLISD